MTASVVSSLALATTPRWSEARRGGTRGRVVDEGSLDCEPLDGAGDGVLGGWIVELDEEIDSLRMGRGDRDMGVTPVPSRSNTETSEAAPFDRKWENVGLGSGEW
jgi:hypothetical protein